MVFERGAGGRVQKKPEEIVPPKKITIAPQVAKALSKTMVGKKLLSSENVIVAQPSPTATTKAEPMLPSDTILTREVLASDALSNYNERGAVIEGKIIPYGQFTVTFEGGRQITPSSKNELVSNLVEQRKKQYYEQGEGFIKQGYTPVQTEEGIRYVKQTPQLLSSDYVPQRGDVQREPGGPIYNVPETEQPYLTGIETSPLDAFSMATMGTTPRAARMADTSGLIVTGTPAGALYATPEKTLEFGAEVALQSIVPYGLGKLVAVAAPIAEAATGLWKGIYTGTKVANVGILGTMIGVDVGSTIAYRQAGMVTDEELIAKGIGYGASFGFFGMGLGTKLTIADIKGKTKNVFDFFKEGGLEQPLIGERVPTTENIDMFITEGNRGLGIYEYPKKGSLDIFEITKGKRSEIPASYGKEITRLPGLDIIEASPGKGVVIEDFIRPRTGVLIGETTIKTIPSGGGGFIPGRNVPSMELNVPVDKELAGIYQRQRLAPYDLRSRPVEGWDEYFKGLKELQKTEWIDVGKKETGLFTEITDVNLRGGIVRSDKVKVIPEEYFRKPSKPSGVLDTVLSKKGKEMLISSTEGELGRPMRKVDVFDVIKGKENVETVLGERVGGREQKYFWEDRVISKEKPSLLTEDEIARLTDIIIERNKPVSELVKVKGEREVTLLDRLKVDEGFRPSGTFESPELTVRSPYERLNIRELVAAEKGVSGGSGYWSGVKPSGVERPSIDLSDFIVSKKGGVRILPVYGEIAMTMEGRQIGERKISFVGLVSGQQLGELQLQDLGRIQNTEIQQELAQQQEQTRITIQDVASIQEQGLEQNQRQRQKQQQIQALQTLQIQESIYDSIQETILDTELIVDLFTPSFTITEKPPEPVVEIEPGIPGIPELEEEGLGFGGDQAYVVKVRGKQYSHGRKVGDDSFHRASGPLSFDDAMNKAVAVVGGSEKAAFMLEAVKEKPQKGERLPSWTNEIYKYNQKDKDTWIEQPGFRIDSSGEIRAITMKGIEARRRF